MDYVKVVIKDRDKVLKVLLNRVRQEVVGVLQGEEVLQEGEVLP